jgi:enoyl-CoA hydratase
MTHLLRTYDRGVLRVTINRPAKRNALSREALQEMRTVFEAHAVREDLRLALVAGAGCGCRAEFKAV